MDKTLYVVSGYMRTGTSMMMHALEEGGMTASYKQSRDVMKNRFADEHYDPNIGGLFELERRDFLEFGFPRKYAGTVLKALNFGVPRMAVMSHGIRVVFMRRDAEEIRQSFDAFFDQPLQNAQHLARNMDAVVEQIRNRRDVLSTDIFWYRNVVKEPKRHFQMLAAHGWPVDAEKAAAVVDPGLCRFKIENLEIGIP